MYTSVTIIYLLHDELYHGLRSLYLRGYVFVTNLSK